MNYNKEEILNWRREACVITRVVNNRTQYRISPRPLHTPDDVPQGGFLSNWCFTEERAWEAAIHRRWHKVYDRESW
jgi:hypothetical protein